ncbi:hypothetical protein [Roseobacter sp. A03A-229]
MLEDVALSLERCAAQVQDRAYTIALQRDAARIARLITLAADLERLARRARRTQEQSPTLKAPSGAFLPSRAAKWGVSPPERRRERS